MASRPKPGMSAVQPQPDGTTASMRTRTASPGCGAVDEDRAGDRIHPREIEPLELVGLGARLDLAAARIERLELDAVAGGDPEDRRQRVVPAPVVMLAVDRVAHRNLGMAVRIGRFAVALPRPIS